MKKDMYIERSVPFHTKPIPPNKQTTTKVVTPHTPKNATFVTPTTAAVKRKKDTEPSLCIQDKVDSLTVSQKSGPIKDGLAHLLLQGLRSEDKNIIENVLL